jgi:hypothetical protein
MELIHSMSRGRDPGELASTGAIDFLISIYTQHTTQHIRDVDTGDFDDPRSWTISHASSMAFLHIIITPNHPFIHSSKVSSYPQRWVNCSEQQYSIQAVSGRTLRYTFALAKMNTAPGQWIRAGSTGHLQSSLFSILACNVTKVTKDMWCLQRRLTGVQEFAHDMDGIVETAESDLGNTLTSFELCAAHLNVVLESFK